MLVCEQFFVGVLRQALTVTNLIRVDVLTEPDPRLKRAIVGALDELAELYFKIKNMVML